mmetsp:Transcript_14510/g.23067  ORF Transcript_14510/g.23067 Transcript_14510/m.23067 type:complete len:87 (-) Transcript_14510:893-1153(-)
MSTSLSTFGSQLQTVLNAHSKNSDSFFPAIFFSRNGPSRVTCIPVFDILDEKKTPSVPLSEIRVPECLPSDPIFFLGVEIIGKNAD